MPVIEMRKAWNVLVCGEEVTERRKELTFGEKLREPVSKRVRWQLVLLQLEPSLSPS